MGNAMNTSGAGARELGGKRHEYFRGRSTRELDGTRCEYFRGMSKRELDWTPHGLQERA